MSSKPLSRAAKLMQAQPERERGRTKGGLETEEERRCEGAAQSDEISLQALAQRGAQCLTSLGY